MKGSQRREFMLHMRWGGLIAMPCRCHKISANECLSGYEGHCRCSMLKMAKDGRARMRDAVCGRDGTVR